MKFKVNQFSVKRISPFGAWLVESDEAFDISMLFLRVQEFYESSNPKFRGHTFTMMEYMRWYSFNLSEHKSFTYANDWRGFNVPSHVINEYMKTPIQEDPNEYDVMFSAIIEKIRSRMEFSPFYLLGTVKGDVSTLDHEISHAMWMLLIGYREAAGQLILAMPSKERKKLYAALKKKGYAQAVLDDEVMAYMATGLIDGFEEFDCLRMPFMKLFYDSKAGFIG